MRASDFLTEFLDTNGDGGKEDPDSFPLTEFADIIEQYLGRGYTRQDREKPEQVSVKFEPKDKSRNGAILYSVVGKQGEYPTVNVHLLDYEQGFGRGRKAGVAIPKTRDNALKLAELIFNAQLNEFLNKLTESTFSDHEEQLRDFVAWCVKKLKIKQALPEIRFQDAKEGPDQHHTGYYSDTDDVMWIYTGNRNMIDIMRTVAHELTHRKQHEDGRVNGNQAYPGSPIEQEADAVAGYLMKLYGKKNPEIIE
jgi:hypothetical protein